MQFALFITVSTNFSVVVDFTVGSTQTKSFNQRGVFRMRMPFDPVKGKILLKPSTMCSTSFDDIRSAKSDEVNNISNRLH